MAQDLDGTVSLDGKVAIVTGASRGIGKAIALELARQGADVAVCARTEQATDDAPGSIHDTAREVQELGVRALALRVDVTSDADLQSMVERTLAELGSIDILVNNAGALGGGGAFLGGDPSLLDHFYRTNVRAPYVCAQLAGAKMAERGGGVIFNISSGLARRPPPPVESAPDAHRRGGGPGVVYGMSKAALDRFGAGVAAELHEHKIAVVNIYPGFTLTERLKRTLPAGSDLSRMERPETTAKAIAFICRDPMPYSGQFVVARELAEQHGL